MTLTIDQETALNKIVNWIDNDTQSYLYGLFGPAGTGKTFLTNLIFKKCKYNWGAIVTAPTHKAKNVISSASGLDSTTFQALCGLAPNTSLDNFDINNPKFARRKQPTIPMFKIIGGDEVSMLNEDMCKLIRELAYQYKVKFLLIGDLCQVPPVGESVSPIINYCDHISELKQPVRQKPNNPLVPLLNAIRCDIETISNGFCNDTYAKFIDSASILLPDLNYISLNNDKNSKGQKNKENILRFLAINAPITLNKEGQGYEFTRNDEYFKNEILTKFNSDEFNQNFNLAKVCTFTNDKTKEWNNVIRNTIFNNPKDLLIEKDILMSYKTIQKGATEILTNSEDYIITNLEFGNDGKLKGWFTTIKNLATNNDSVLFVVHPDSYEDFCTLHESFHFTARTKKGKYWKDYFNWSNNYLLLDNLNDWRFERIRNFAKSNNIAQKNLPKKSIDYGYSITTHKAQGSTYNYSFVESRDIAIRLKVGTDSPKIKRLQYLNLMYVAISRAKIKSTILI